MDAAEIMRRMAHNNAWANLRLERAVGALDDTAYRTTTRTSFFPSIHLTLVHLLIVDRFYVDALGHGGRGAAIWADEPGLEHDADRAALRLAQRAVDRELIAITDGLSAAGLDAEIALERRDHVQRERCGDVLLHLFQHQVHHRGQVHAMLAGTPATPP